MLNAAAPLDLLTARIRGILEGLELARQSLGEHPAEWQALAAIVPPAPVNGLTERPCAPVSSARPIVPEPVSGLDEADEVDYQGAPVNPEPGYGQHVEQLDKPGRIAAEKKRIEMDEAAGKTNAATKRVSTSDRVLSIARLIFANGPLKRREIAVELSTTEAVVGNVTRECDLFELDRDFKLHLSTKGHQAAKALAGHTDKE